MSATAVLVIIIGVFVIVNAANFVGVIQGNKKINFSGAKPLPTLAGPHGG